MPDPTSATVPSVPSAAPSAWPRVIQGGMGVGVSSVPLARVVARRGQLGVVSGTALDLTLARKLQDGDPDGTLRAAIAAFPVPAVADEVLQRWWRPDGRAPGKPYAPAPRLSLRPTLTSLRLAVVANFVEVWLAKQGHDGLIGVNYLEKVQMATPPAVYGAILAGADYILMGAGIPSHLPALLNALAAGKVGTLPVDVDGSAKDDGHAMTFDPSVVLGEPAPVVARPLFLAIVSSHVLAAYLARDPITRPDGFVVEGPKAGGHNAPPRGRMVLDEAGEPVYGPKEAADLAKMGAVGLPFWLAGAYGTPERVTEAVAAGAAGVQIGTVFALSMESGLSPHLREALMTRLIDGSLRNRTDPLASPTGFPFKVAQVPETMADHDLRDGRERLCDLGYLRTPYVRDTGAIGYRCAAEPIHVYTRKGGDEANTTGRTCLCNGLVSSIGLGQTRPDGYEEPPLLTLGDEVASLAPLLARHAAGWSADEALDWLLGEG